jgi:hypothetical protein
MRAHRFKVSTKGFLSAAPTPSVRRGRPRRDALADAAMQLHRAGKSPDEIAVLLRDKFTIMTRREAVSYSSGTHPMRQIWRALVPLKLQIAGTAVVLLLLCATCAGQAVALIPDSGCRGKRDSQPSRDSKPAGLAPGESTPMHRHDRDMMAVFVDAGSTRNTLLRHQPVADKMAVGGPVSQRGSSETGTLAPAPPDCDRSVLDPQGKRKSGYVHTTQSRQHHGLRR